jgi:hypothetical protein
VERGAHVQTMLFASRYFLCTYSFQPLSSHRWDLKCAAMAIGPNRLRMRIQKISKIRLTGKIFSKAGSFISGWLGSIFE